MPTADDIRDRIAQTAADGVESASQDGTSMKVLPIDDQIKAEKHVAGTDAATRPHRGVRFTQIIPPGASS